jgi:hypothetical protein
MIDQKPPPLPDRDAGLKTYWRALVYVITAMFFISFASLFLVPRIEQIWKDTGRRSEIMEAMIATIGFLKSNANPLILVLVALIGLLEWKVSWWKRYRGVIVEVIVYGVVFVTLAFFAAIATSALILAPLINLNRP